MSRERDGGRENVEFKLLALDSRARVDSSSNVGILGAHGYSATRLAGP